MARYTPKTLTDVETLLSELDRVRGEGYALDDEEEAEGVFCVGSAFFDHQGACAGALSVTGLKVDVPLREVRQLGVTVKDHADRMTALLGGVRPRHVVVKALVVEQPGAVALRDWPEISVAPGEVLVAPTARRACAAPTSSSSTAPSTPPTFATRSCSATSGSANWPKDSTGSGDVGHAGRR